MAQNISTGWSARMFEARPAARLFLDSHGWAGIDPVPLERQFMALAKIVEEIEAADAAAAKAAADAVEEIVSEDDVPLFVGLKDLVIDADADGEPGKKRGPRGEGRRGKKGGEGGVDADGNQLTLDDLFGRQDGSRVAPMFLPAAPKPPKRAIPRPLLDKTSLKAAKEQFDVEGGLVASSNGGVTRAQLAGLTGAQMAKYLAFAWEYLGERPRADLLKRKRAAEEKQGKAAADAAATAGTTADAAVEVA